MERLTFGGFLLRLAATALLVVATYNPSGYSVLHWIAASFPSIQPSQAVAGLALLGAWAFCVHATWRSLGAFGVLLVVTLCLALVWLIASWGWIRFGGGVLGWLADTLLAVLLAIGVSWSLFERRATGQVVVDENGRP